VQLTVRYFASIRESIGQGSEVLVSHAVDLAMLRDELIGRGAPYAQALARDKTVRVALNQVMRDETTPLSDGAEVAFFPPVTGG
jgi:molybdopterin synthase sulfur carrier subunit